jgi:PAS domain S-box-containing protein
MSSSVLHQAFAIPELSILSVGVLALAAASALWVALISGRRAAPGSQPFQWAMLAIAYWCLISALHTLTPSITGRILWAKAQYFAIATVPLLWLLFALDYGRWWVVSGRWLAVLGTIPLITIAMAWTNEWHGWLWSSITPASAEPGARLVYRYGPWFWIAASYNYLLLLYGTWVLGRSLVRRPPPFRRQSVALLVGALIPWIGNLIYLARLIPIPGLDITPLAFAASGLICAYGLFRYRIFELTPAARNSVIEMMIDAVLVLDRHQHVLDANPAAARLLRYAPDQLIGKTAHDLEPQHQDWMALCRPEQEINTEIVLDQAGESRHYALSCTLFHDRKRRWLGQLIVLRDITIQKQATAALQQATEQATLANRAQSEFLATMSHELRTPLTTILGYCDLLQLKIEEFELHQFSYDIERIQMSATYLLTLLGSVLDLAAIEAGHLPLNQEIFDVPEQVTMMQRMLQPVFDQHKNRLVIVCPADLGSLQADLTKLRQILFNLLSNAAKFTKNGLIVLAVERLPAEQLAPGILPLTSDQTSSWIQFTVRDTGIGMTPAQLQTLFQPFTQADTAIHRSYGGTGLGLAISRQFCQMMGGDISVSSALGQGTTFKIVLPADGAPIPALPAHQ